MSDITNAIFMHGLGEVGNFENGDGFAIVDELHHAMEKAGIFSGKFVRVDEYAAFGKGMTAAVYVAGFNHLNEPMLVNTIRSLLWEWPDEVQLFVKREEEERFSEIVLFQDEPTAAVKRMATKGLRYRGPEQQDNFRGAASDRLAEYRHNARVRGQNPLNREPWPTLTAQEMSAEEWLFEVTEIRAEHQLLNRIPKDRSRAAINRALVGELERSFEVVLVYQGEVAELRCASTEIGDERYDAYKKIFSTLNLGDWIEFSGSIEVNQAGIWEIREIRNLTKHDG